MRLFFLFFILFGYSAFSGTTLEIYNSQKQKSPNNLNKRKPASLTAKKTSINSKHNSTFDSNKNDDRKRNYQKNYGDYELEILDVIGELENEL